LQGVPVKENPCERQHEETDGVQILHGIVKNFFRRIAHKPAHNKTSAEYADGRGSKRDKNADEKSFAHSLVDTFVFSCAEVLAAVGGNRSAECRHGLGGEVFHFGGGSEGSHNTGTENIDCALQDHGSDSGDGIVERHRNTDGKHIEHTVSVEVVIFPAGF